MDTKFILIGGRPHKSPDGGKLFSEDLPMVKLAEGQFEVMVR